MGSDSEYSKYLVWVHMIVDPLSSLLPVEVLSPKPIPHSQHHQLRVQSQLLMHWMERVLTANDAPKSRSSRPVRAESFAEGAVLRDLVESPLLSIFGVEILVDKPREVSFELGQYCRKLYSSISPIHHLV